MSTDDEDSSYPRSVRHKQILDKAAAHPDASMDELASMVPSATAELVERTLDEYGDPAAGEESNSPDGGDEQDAAPGDASGTDAGPSTDGGAAPDMTDATTTSTDNATESPASPEAGDQTDADDGETSDDASSVDTAPDSEDGHDEAEPAGETDTDRGDDGPPTGGDTDPSPVAADLSPKQRAVLELIAADPTATQREIGEELGVSSATVNNRVNSIDGFEWTDRASFVETVLELEAETESEPVETAASESPGEVESTLSDIEGHLTALDERVGSLEAQIEQAADACDQSTSGLDDPELVHKVIHACLESERISEDEELQLLEQILR